MQDKDIEQQLDIVQIEDEYYTFLCPHCKQYIQVHTNEINCCIFRHAVYKNTLAPINPHATKEECDKLMTEEKVFGCAGPFRLYKNNDIWYVRICDYI